MKEAAFSSWTEFKDFVGKMAPSIRQPQRLLFRGQADSSWSLTTTLDRARTFGSFEERERYRESLRGEFRRLAAGLLGDEVRSLADVNWELLGRHHGLPSRILDWTTSPYVAAFFAFDDASRPQASKVAVWALNRNIFLEEPYEQVQVLDDDDMVWHNPRAVEQRAVFLRIDTDTHAQPLEGLIREGLYKLTIPGSESRVALADLDASLINRRSLFRDLDGAARTAASRVLNAGEH